LRCLRSCARCSAECARSIAAQTIARVKDTTASAAPKTAQIRRSRRDDRDLAPPPLTGLLRCLVQRLKFCSEARGAPACLVAVVCSWRGS
jgi:hypothetical protein